MSTYPPLSVNQEVVQKRSQMARVAWVVLPISIGVSLFQDEEQWMAFLWPLWGYCAYVIFQFVNLRFKKARLPVEST